MARAGLKYLDAAPALAAAPAEEAPAERAGLKYLDTTEEEPGRLEALLRGVKQGASFGLGDEITGALESAFTDKTYRQARDEARAADAAAQEAHGGYFAGGELGGGLATALIPGGLAAKAGLTGLKGAAALGAAYGVGDSTADLTQGDVGGVLKDAALGAGAGAAVHGVIGLAGKAARAMRPALERYATGDEGLLASAAKSKAGRAAVGAAVGAYEDDDALEGAVKGAGVALVGPKLLKGTSKPVKAAILLALRRGGVEAAEKAAAEAAPEVAERIIKREVASPADSAIHSLEGKGPGVIPREEAMAQVVSAAKAGALTPELADQAVLSGVPEVAVKRLQGVSQRLAIEAPEYTPPGAARALEGEPERLALGQVEEAPRAAAESPAGPPKVKLGTRTVAPEELAGAQWNGQPLEQADVDLRVMREAPDLGAVRDAKAKPVTVAVSPDGRQEVVDGRHRILVARERGEPLKVKFVRGAKGLDDAPSVAETDPVGPDTRAAAIDAFKAAVAKSKRLEASGDKLRAKTWLASAERDFKAALKDLPAPAEEKSMSKPLMTETRRKELDAEFERQMAPAPATPPVAPASAKPIVRAPRASAGKATEGERRAMFDEVAAADAQVAPKVVPPAHGVVPSRGADDASFAKFAAQIHGVTAAMGDEGRYLANRKVFIRDVQKALGIKAEDKAKFHTALVEANRRGLLDLSRADLVGAMDPRQVAESEVADMGSTFNFITDKSFVDPWNRKR